MEKERGSNAFVMEKLDCAFINQQWVDVFPYDKLDNLVSDTSDHNPLKLVSASYFPSQKPRRFKFKNHWLADDGFFDVVQEGGHACPSHDALDKLKSCSS